jgi:pyridoxal phosphate enzyme (YggS family)
MSSYIVENLNSLKTQIANACEACGRKAGDIILVAVSKTFPDSDVLEAFNAGQFNFGENKVQEMVKKQEVLSKYELKWHLIGHLQTNKVKYIAEFVHLVHSVDSFKLALEIDKQAAKAKRRIDILVQVNTSDEMQKSGVEIDETKKLCNEIKQLENVNLSGLMTIGKFTDNTDIIRDNFRTLKKLYDEIKPDFRDFNFLSMGMTSDFEIAIEEGANMLRIGSAVFGYRNYNIETTK